MELYPRWRTANAAFRNRGDGTFEPVSREWGFNQTGISYGMALGDLDNDGSLEVVINNLGARPSLLKNYAPAKSWLLARLVGTKCNRDAVGARAYVYVHGRRLSGEIQTGTSYISQNDSRLHFGLGDDQAYDRIEVQWPGGVRETFPGGKANRIIELKQGAGTAKTSTLKPGEGRPHI